MYTNGQHTIATAKGHLDQERKNLQSTQLIEDLDFFPPSQQPNSKTYETCAALVPFTT